MNWAMLGDKAGLATTDLVMFAVPGAKEGRGYNSAMWG